MMNQSHYTFSIVREPYSVPLIFSRIADEWADVLAEFPDALLIQQVSI